MSLLILFRLTAPLSIQDWHFVLFCFVLSNCEGSETLFCLQAHKWVWYSFISTKGLISTCFLISDLFYPIGCFPLEYFKTAAATAELLQLCPTLCDPIDGLLPGSPVPGILQARTLKWVAISFSNSWKWKVKVKSLDQIKCSSNQSDSPICKTTSSDVFVPPSRTIIYIVI